MTSDELLVIWATRPSSHKPRVLVTARDYAYEGRLVSVFDKVRGAIRAAVEDDYGRLFFHNAEQLTDISVVTGRLTPDSSTD